MRKPGAKGAPTNKQFQQAAKTAKKPVKMQYGGMVKKKGIKK